MALSPVPVHEVEAVPSARSSLRSLAVAIVRALIVTPIALLGVALLIVSVAIGSALISDGLDDVRD